MYTCNVQRCSESVCDSMFLKTSPATIFCQGFFFFFFSYKAAPILALYIPSIFMIWMTKFIHGETAFPREKKKKRFKKAAISTPVHYCIELHWLFHRHFHLFAWGLLIHKKKIKTHQVRVLSYTVYVHTIVPALRWLFKCIAVEVDIFTQSSTLRFLIQ